ncbi:MAG: proline--tRNA ligase, partial [Clostridiales bacterium]|nr:proline--tRNA ligase [Clostridiales bacterium]
GEIETRLAEILEKMQSDMLVRAKEHLAAHTYTAKNMLEFEDIINSKPGFIKAMWCMDEACELEIKERTGATSRCMPFEQEHIDDKCVCCGKPAKTMVYWGKAY